MYRLAASRSAWLARPDPVPESAPYWKRQTCIAARVLSMMVDLPKLFWPRTQRASASSHICSHASRAALKQFGALRARGQVRCQERSSSWRCLGSNLTSQ